MTITAFLPILLLVLGLVVYFICCGLTKGTVGDVAKWTYVVSLLAFLMLSGAQSCSTSVAGGGGGGAQHR